MSKASLNYPERGMHFDCLSSIEFQEEGNREWFRVEAYRAKDGSLAYAGYQRVGIYWSCVTSSDEPGENFEALNRYGMHLMKEARVAAGEFAL